MYISWSVDLMKKYQRREEKKMYLKKKKTYQGKKVCMAILQTSTVCLMILMRHSCIKHCIFLISFPFLNHSLTFYTFFLYSHSRWGSTKHIYAHTPRRECPAHKKCKKNFTSSRSLQFFFSFLGSSWGSSCTRNSPLTHTHTHTIHSFCGSPQIDDDDDDDNNDDGGDGDDYVGCDDGEGAHTHTHF